MLLHLDTRTYFLTSLNELFEWNKADLTTKIMDLNLSKGNNQFLNGLISETRFKDKYNNVNLTVSSTLKIKNILYTIHKSHNSSETEYISKYCISSILGGIK